MAVAFDAVGPSSTPASSASSTSLSWSHTCGASATYLLAGITMDHAPSDAGITTTATYNSVTMTSLYVRHTGDGTAGYLQVWGLANPGTGSALSVAISASGGTPLSLNGGSLSFTGAGALSAVQTAMSGSATTASESFTPTVSGNMVAAFCGAGSSLTASGSFTGKFAGGTNGQGAGFVAGSVLASTGSAMTPSWTISSADQYALIAVEVQVPTSVNTSPAWAVSYDTTAVAGTGTWVNPANAEGAPDGSWATWTAP